MPTTQIQFSPEEDEQADYYEPERYPGERRDYWSQMRMDKLNEQLKVVHSMKLPLCGECIEFHGKQLTCAEVEEYMWIDQRLLGYAKG